MRVRTRKFWRYTAIAYSIVSGAMIISGWFRVDQSGVATFLILNLDAHMNKMLSAGNIILETVRMSKDEQEERRRILNDKDELKKFEERIYEKYPIFRMQEFPGGGVWLALIYVNLSNRVIDPKGPLYYLCPKERVRIFYDAKAVQVNINSVGARRCAGVSVNGSILPNDVIGLWMNAEDVEKDPITGLMLLGPGSAGKNVADGTLKYTIAWAGLLFFLAWGGLILSLWMLNEMANMTSLWMFKRISESLLATLVVLVVWGWIGYKFTLGGWSVNAVVSVFVGFNPAQHAAQICMKDRCSILEVLAN